MGDKKRVALITGANRGLGLAMSEKLAEMGITVIMACRSKEKGEQAAKPLKNKGFNVIVVQCDVEKTGDIESMHKEVSKEFDKIDILINNAGVNSEAPDIRIENLDVPLFEKIMNINLRGTIVTCKKFIPMIKKSESGRIINFSSGLGELTPDRMGPFPSYSISKTAVNMLTKFLAAELKNDNVIVNSVDPGWVKTDMGGPDAMLDIPDGIDTAVWLATAGASELQSGYFYKERQVIPW